MRIVAFILVILGLLGAALWRTLDSFGHFDDVSRDFAGRCTPVTGVAGPEDIVIDKARGLAFISSLNRRDDESRGAIHIVDPADPLAAGGWRDMTGGAPAAFKPLGLDYYEGEGVRRLFVVNAAANAVELYDVGEDGALAHLESFSEPRLTSPNNVAAVGPRAFYVTNDVKAGRDSMLGNFRFLTRAASGAVLFTDGTAWRVAADGLRFANGVAVSSDGRRLYAAETAGEAVRIYERNPGSGALRALQTIETPFAPDNITIDAEGAVWVAGLPKPLALPAHAADPDMRVPSAVMRIDEGGAREVIYRDPGEEISAATVAARAGQALLIGALYENKFLICELPGAEI